MRRAEGLTMYHFKGDAAHLARAIADNRAPHVNAGEARRYRPYERLLNLVAQASTAPADHAAGILAEAERQRDAIACLLDSADSVLAEARAGLGIKADADADADAGQADR